MNTVHITDDRGNHVRRFGNGRWYVKPAAQGKYSEKASLTLAEAQAHLDRLLKGLVKFNALRSGEPHSASFRSDFCNGARSHSHIHAKG